MKGLTGVKKILFVTLSNFGDVVLSTPVLQSLATAYPGAVIDVMAGAGAGALFEGEARIRRFIPYVKKATLAEKGKLLGAVRHERYDVIVDLRRSLFGLLGGARRRNRYFDFPSKRMHRALRHLRSLQGICAPLDPLTAPSWIRVSDAEREAARALVGKDHGPLLVAAPGSKSDLKKWPAAYFARVLDSLADEKKARVVLVGDANDAADAARVASALSRPPIDLTGRTSFREMTAVLAEAAFVLTNDSAPLHLAEALNVPTLALFGPTDPAKYGTRRPGNVSARHLVSCSPCEAAQCRYHHECFKEMLPGEVLGQARVVLDRQVQPRKKPRILLIRLDRIGDVVLSLPAVQAVRAHYPDAHMAMMVRPGTAAIPDAHPAIDETIFYAYEKKGRHSSAFGTFRILKEIRDRKFDIAFILHPSRRSYLVPFFAGIPVRAGFESKWSFLTTHAVVDRRKEGTRHESAYTLDIVAALGVPPKADPGIWPVTESEARASEVMTSSSGQRTIAFHAGASCISKKWPKERFAELGRRVARTFPHRILIVGGPEEKEAGAYLAASIGERATDLTGSLDLKQLAAVLKRSEALVSNDSGPVHIAAAVGTPTVTIFGRNQPGLGPVRWQALGDGHRVVRQDVGCAVCLAHDCTIGFECLQAVDTDRVFKELSEVLA